MKSASKLERLTFIFLSVAACVSIMTMAANWLGWPQPPLADVRSAAAPRSNLKGMRLMQTGGRQTQPALVIAYSVNCPICASSVSDIRSLISDVRRQRPGIEVIVAARELPSIVSATLKAADIIPDRVTSWDTIDASVNAVPAYFLLDTKGIVVFQHVGRLALLPKKNLIASASMML